MSIDFGDHLEFLEKLTDEQKKHLEESRKLLAGKKDIKPTQEAIYSPVEAMYAPTKKTTDNLIKITNETRLYGLKTRELLEFAANGEITLCHPIPNSESLLWVISKDLLQLNDPLTRESAKECLAIAVPWNNEHYIIRDLKNTEWVVLNKNDCKKLLDVGSHSQSVFDSGWKSNKDGAFETTYPSVPINTDPHFPQGFRADRFSFILLKKELRHMVSPPFKFAPENEYGLKFNIDEILVSRTELLNLIQIVSPDKHARIIGKEDLINITRIKDHNNVSMKILYLMAGCDRFWRKYEERKKTEYEAKFLNKTLISKYFMNEHKTSMKSFPAFSRTQAEFAYRIIKPDSNDTNKLITDSGAIVTTKLVRLLKASAKIWSDVNIQEHDTYYPPEVIEKFLLGFGFADSDTETAAGIIRPENAAKGRPKTTP